METTAIIRSFLGRKKKKEGKEKGFWSFAEEGRTLEEKQGCGALDGSGRKTLSRSVRKAGWSKKREEADLYAGEKKKEEGQGPKEEEGGGKRKRDTASGRLNRRSWEKKKKRKREVVFVTSSAQAKKSTSREGGACGWGGEGGGGGKERVESTEKRGGTSLTVFLCHLEGEKKRRG